MTVNTPPTPTSKQKTTALMQILIMSFLIICAGFLIRATRDIYAPAATLTPANTPTQLATITPPNPKINIPDVTYATIPPSAPEYTLPLHEIDASGVTGAITFKDVAGTLAILLHIDGLTEEEVISPVELHTGTCAAPAALAYPLVAPDGGESETDLSINLEQFNTQKPMAVILYRSTQDHTPLACGDIP